MPTRKLGAAILQISLLLVVVASPLQAARQSTEIASPERTFIGPDGNPLPFENDAELMEFLLAAQIIDQSTIGSGINRSQKVTLEKDGVRANAIFRQADYTERDASVGGRSYRIFRDSYLFEPAAYDVAKLLGITNIPPAVLRRVGRRDGSMQIWGEDALDEDDRESCQPTDISDWIRQLRDMILFDNCIYNADRNAGNMLITPDYTLVMIDHTRGFQEKTDIMDPERLTLVNHDTWEKLRGLSEEAMRDAVRPYLAPNEMNSLLRRHQAIIEHFEALIEERGEGSVVIP